MSACYCTVGETQDFQAVDRVTLERYQSEILYDTVGAIVGGCVSFYSCYLHCLELFVSLTEWSGECDPCDAR